MRDPKRVEWESDPLRPLVQSRAWNRAIIICFFGLPIMVLLLAFLGVFGEWNWKELTALTMFAAASSSVVDIAGRILCIETDDPRLTK